MNSSEVVKHKGARDSTIRGKSYVQNEQTRVQFHKKLNSVVLFLRVCGMRARDKLRIKLKQERIIKRKNIATQSRMEEGQFIK